MGDGEAESEDGVALDAYSYALPSMQEQAVDAMDNILTDRLVLDWCQETRYLHRASTRSYRLCRGLRKLPGPDSNQD